MAEATAAVPAFHEPISSVEHMTTPATKPTRKRAAAKASVTPIESKRTKRSTAKATPKSDAQPAPKPAAEAKPESVRALPDEQAHELAKLHAAMTQATAAFEAAVVELLRSGASPSHVGAAVSMGNSSIRRIGWRHGVGTPPPAQQR